MIKPTVGRVVHVRNRSGSYFKRLPEVALICFVHSDSIINVAGFDANGDPFKVLSLPLLQAEGESQDGQVGMPDYQFAEWPRREDAPAEVGRTQAG